MKSITSFMEDQLVGALLKGKYLLRILSPDHLQLLDPNSGHKVHIETSILKEANRIIKRDLDRKYYCQQGQFTSTKGFNIATVTIEQPAGHEEQTDFSIRKFKFRLVGQNSPLLVGVQRNNKQSEILIFQGELLQSDADYREHGEGFIGKIEFASAGLKYRVDSSGLSPNDLSMMPDGSFAERRLLVGFWLTFSA